jgi:hypothetical protein
MISDRTGARQTWESLTASFGITWPLCGHDVRAFGKLILSLHRK